MYPSEATTFDCGAVPCKPRHPPGFQWSRINATVLGVLVLFGFLYYVDVFLIIVPWLSYSVPGVTNLGALTITTAVSVYCYMYCVLFDPGCVPSGWSPDEVQGTVTEVKRKTGAPRFCQKCQQYKPPRSHHCRVCNRCVLKMDHHCPWTNNCIGHANYRGFLLFLIYVNAALLHTLGLICAHVLHALQVSRQQRVIRTGLEATPVHLHDGWLSSTWMWVAMQTCAFFMALPLAIGLQMLLVWHVNLLAHNKTTIEYQEGVRSSLQLDLFEHPYDLGVVANLTEVLGDNPANWCMPPCSGTEGGTAYTTVYDNKVLGLP